MFMIMLHIFVCYFIYLCYNMFCSNSSGLNNCIEKFANFSKTEYLTFAFCTTFLKVMGIIDWTTSCLIKIYQLLK